ncbi:MAG: hypothetical protein Q9170_000617 [Blastenia crenularia]
MYRKLWTNEESEVLRNACREHPDLSTTGIAKLLVNTVLTRRTVSAVKSQLSLLQLSTTLTPAVGRRTFIEDLIAPMTPGFLVRISSTHKGKHELERDSRKYFAYATKVWQDRERTTSVTPRRVVCILHFGYSSVDKMVDMDKIKDTFQQKFDGESLELVMAGIDNFSANLPHMEFLFQQVSTQDFTWAVPDKKIKKWNVHSVRSLMDVYRIVQQGRLQSLDQEQKHAASLLFDFSKFAQLKWAKRRGTTSNLTRSWT